ncbi:interleukin-18 receptor 1-like [Thunnus thynnus]|uniref:interleukin-18 receptor 1-like n=1 Tax=Thunnus thynnus TaxID=8237 RepID=UPI00352946D5
MKLSSVVKALGSLCLLLADGFPVSVEEGSPDIIGPRVVQLKTKPGELLRLHCKASTNSEDTTLIYWLVNGSFPEDTCSDGRIEETEESILENGTILKRSLVLKNVTSEDLKSTFTCVVMNTIGVAKKVITLTAKCHDCRARKKMKH